MAQIGACKIRPDRGAVTGGIDVACREGGLEGRVILIDLGAGIDEQELLCQLRAAGRVAPLEYVVISLPSGVVKNFGSVCGIEPQPGSGCSDGNSRSDLRNPITLL